MYFLSSKEISRAVSPNHHRHHHHHHFRWNRWRTTPNPYRSTWDPWRTTESPWWEYNENSTRPTTESWEEATEYPWEVNATTEGWWTILRSLITYSNNVFSRPRAFAHEARQIHDPFATRKLHDCQFEVFESNRKTREYKFFKIIHEKPYYYLLIIYSK